MSSVTLSNVKGAFRPVFYSNNSQEQIFFFLSSYREIVSLINLFGFKQRSGDVMSERNHCCSNMGKWHFFFFFEPVLNCDIIYIYIFAAYLLLCVKNSGKNVPYVPCSFSADLSLFYTLMLHARVYHLPKVEIPIPI